MRWCCVPRAEIDTEIREALEQRGTETIRVLLLLPNSVLETAGGKRFTIDDAKAAILLWLKEQADWAEQRETWLITMEVAITFFVLAELVMSVVSFLHCSK